jgi:hypothetical protein
VVVINVKIFHRCNIEKNHIKGTHKDILTFYAKDKILEADPNLQVFVNLPQYRRDALFNLQICRTKR